ncbi:hypothetical protein AGRA3207_002843 [Actinomadura graeca]|uniref:Uncharacterized protein n=1 Tax=Actinomadura graeca TaxID=2750812 RepID=A0ABX8QWV3_9ACTN|nr:hypothetical protein [Actinomadura graeca]QXJ21927.1 hypothetical protein AGRA3207_002843 [Actinomadura graeca]
MTVMALHLGRNIGHKRHEPGEHASPERRRLWFRRNEPGGDTEAGRTGEHAGTTAVAARKPRRWRRSRHNPVSMMILAAGWAAVVILALGMLLTWGDANPGNTIVDATLDAGRWLATPFHDVFTRSDPDEQLYINWAIAGVVYYAIARTLSWMTRF